MAKHEPPSPSRKADIPCTPLYRRIAGKDDTTTYVVKFDVPECWTRKQLMQKLEEYHIHREVRNVRINEARNQIQTYEEHVGIPVNCPPMANAHGNTYRNRNRNRNNKKRTERRATPHTKTNVFVRVSSALPTTQTTQANQDLCEEEFVETAIQQPLQIDPADQQRETDGLLAML
jgi:hypothetical protein